MAENKWSKAFWIDLAERTGSTFVYGLITMASMDNVLEGPDWDTTLWPIVVLPTVLSILKGFAGNLRDYESGASLVNHPPGPEVQE